jgi:hypothetical protein
MTPLNKNATTSLGFITRGSSSRPAAGQHSLKRQIGGRLSIR